MRFLQLEKIPILEQLQLEEALLRTSEENWCLVTTGAPPAIVMGISGKPEKLVNLPKVTADKIPLIKRFSGGGTVYIDPETIFVTFICQNTLLNLPIQPKPILSWSETFYKPLFKGFSLRENDYVFGEKKFGGNAQYLQKSRWLHHTSFLWDYKPEKMEYLLLPEKRPEYRQSRPHHEFLCTLKPHFPSKQALLDTLTTHLSSHFSLIPTTLKQAKHHLSLPHRKATTTL
ncbi:MAG: putative lipoate-protein ligase A [Chlamydiae bacterium]|nr:putative lipoate-protein ligase A [Chlamydiota bacterium]